MGFSAKIRDFMGYPEDDYEDPGERSEADSPEEKALVMRWYWLSPKNLMMLSG